MRIKPSLIAISRKCIIETRNIIYDSFSLFVPWSGLQYVTKGFIYFRKCKINPLYGPYSILSNSWILLLFYKCSHQSMYMFLGKFGFHLLTLRLSGIFYPRFHVVDSCFFYKNDKLLNDDFCFNANCNVNPENVAVHAFRWC